MTSCATCHQARTPAVLEYYVALTDIRMGIMRVLCRKERRWLCGTGDTSTVSMLDYSDFSPLRNTISYYLVDCVGFTSFSLTLLYLLLESMCP